MKRAEPLVRVEIPARALQLAVGAVARHRAPGEKALPPTPLEGLMVALKPATGEPGSAWDRAVVGATNRYTIALASTDVANAEGEPYVGPSDPSDVWNDLDAYAGLFDLPLTGGSFAADKDPVRDIRRLAEDDPDAEITLTVQHESLRLDGPAGHLLWHRIRSGSTLFDLDSAEPGEHVVRSSLNPDLPGIVADFVDALPADVVKSDRTWSWSMLRLHESLCGAQGALRLIQPRGHDSALVTAVDAPTPRIGLIGPMRPAS